MISCVVLPVLLQNIYTLFHTHRNRQVFWENIESIVITGLLFVLMVYDTGSKCTKIEGTKIKRPGGAEIILADPRKQAGIPENLTVPDN